MRKFVVVFLALAFILISVRAVSADFNLKNWKFWREIRTTSQISGQKLVSFDLDNKIFEGAKPDLSDLRIIDNNGKETPYKLTVEEAKAVTQSFPVRLLNAGSLPGKYTEAVLDVSNSGLSHNSVTLDSPDTNFRKRVEVDASADNATWFVIKPAGEGPLIYDYSLDFKARNTTISYPESNQRFLRLRIVDENDAPIKITGAKIFDNLLIGSREFNLKPVVTVSQKSDAKTTEIQLDLGAKGIPSDHLSFASSDSNFNREVLIEGSSDGKTWNSLGRDVIFSYKTPKYTDSKLTLLYPETNLRYLKLTVFNRDNQPVLLSNFEVMGVLRKVLFQADSGVSYKLYYGNNASRFPEYDFGSYLQYLDTANVSGAVLGQEEKNPSFVIENLPNAPLSERVPYLFSVVLGAGVVVLGFFVFRLLSQVKHRK